MEEKGVIENPETPKKSGTIVYSIDYPSEENSEDDNLIRMFLPKTMEFSYQDDLFKTEIKKGKLFSTSFIGNSADESMMAGTVYFTIKNNCNFSQEDKEIYLKSQPTYTIVKTEKHKKIIGFDAQHAFAIHNINKDTIDLFYTKEIDIKSSNWFTAFHEIDGVLLEYEIERYGLRMSFTAEERKTIHEDCTFDYPKDFVELSFDDYDGKIQGYFNDLKK